MVGCEVAYYGGRPTDLDNSFASPVLNLQPHTHYAVAQVIQRDRLASCILADVEAKHKDQVNS